MNRRRIYCATCARRQKRGSYLRCPLGCGAALCRSRPQCGNQHLPHNCPSYQASRGLLAQEEGPMEQPTDQDVLNVAALVDNLAADAAIEDAFRTEPPTRDEQLAEVLVRQVHEAGDPHEIRKADFLMDLYKLGMFRGDA